MPETKGIALEDIDRLFGGQSHREAGEAMEHDHKLQAAEIENVEMANEKMVGREEHNEVQSLPRK